MVVSILTTDLLSYGMVYYGIYWCLWVFIGTIGVYVCLLGGGVSQFILT